MWSTFHRNGACKPTPSAGQPAQNSSGASRIVEGRLEAKLPTLWTDGKAQPGRSTDIEKVRREKIRDGEDEEGRQPEERRCRCAER